MAKRWRMVNSEVKQMVQEKNTFPNQRAIVYSYDQENQCEESNEDYRNVYHDKHRVFCSDCYRLDFESVHYEWNYIEFRTQNSVLEPTIDDLQAKEPLERQRTMIRDSIFQEKMPTGSTDTRFNLNVSRVNSQLSSKTCKSLNCSTIDRKAVTGGRRKTCC